MTVSVASVVERALDVARDLGEPELVELALRVQESSRTSKLRLLVVGSTGSGRFSVADTILGLPDLLPPSPIPRPPLGVTVRHGASPTAELHGRDAVGLSVLPERLRQMLAAPEIGRRYDALHIAAPAEVLKTIDLQIEAIDAPRDDDDWNEVLAGADYVILVLNATALLSDAEKRFVRERLAPRLGLERVTIVLNMIDLVPEEEQEGLIELIRTFLGPFEREPAIVPFAAAGVRRAFRAGTAPDGGYDALQQLIFDLVEGTWRLRAEALRGSLLVLHDDLARAVARRDALLSIRSNEATAALDNLFSRKDWLDTRVDRIRIRIDSFIGTLLKEQILREIETFSTALRTRLPEEVSSIADIRTIRRYLPGYLEAVWHDFLTARLGLVRARLFEEIEHVADTIEADITELLAEAGIDVTALSETVELLSAARDPFVAPKRGSTMASNIAKGLGLQGMFLLIWNSPLGLASLGASQAVKRVFRGDIDKAEKEAITAAAITATREIEESAKRHVGQQFDTLSESLTAEVTKLYTEAISRVRELLESSLQTKESLDERRAQLASLSRSVLPELRRKIENLEGAA